MEIVNLAVSKQELSEMIEVKNCQLTKLLYNGRDPLSLKFIREYEKLTRWINAYETLFNEKYHF